MMTKTKEFKLEFSLTSYCQARCPTCPRTNEETGYPEPWLKLQHTDFDLFKKTTQNSIYWKEHKLRSVKFCGEYGDPMMHPKVEDFISYCLDNNAEEVIVNTNGGLRNPDWYMKMGERYGQRLTIVFGIDGTDAHVNNLYRVDVDWYRAMDNLRAYSNSPGRAVWQFIVFEHNYHQMDECLRMVDEIGCDEHFFLWNTQPYGLITPEHRTEVDAKYKVEC